MGHGTQKKRVSYKVQPTSDQERAKQYYQSMRMSEGNKMLNIIIEELLSNGMLVR
jgi:hypothetical protein